MTTQNIKPKMRHANRSSNFRLEKGVEGLSYLHLERFRVYMGGKVQFVIDSEIIRLKI